MIDDVEHRRLLVAADLAADHGHEVCDDPLTWEVPIDLIPLH